MSIYGEATTSMGLTKYTYSGGSLYIFLGASVINTGNDENDFIQAQYDAETNYRNDTSIAFWNMVYDQHWRPQVAFRDYYGDKASFRFGGYGHVIFNYSPKSSVKYARLGVRCTHHYYKLVGSTWTPVYIDSRVLNIHYSENNSEFASGQEVTDMVPDLVHPCTEGNKNPSEYVYYDLDIDFIRSMTTNDLILWFHCPFELMPWVPMSVPITEYSAEKIEYPTFTLEIYA